MQQEVDTVFTYLACGAVIAFLAANIFKYLSNKTHEKSIPETVHENWYNYISSLGAGVLFTNGFMHFIHGILGLDDFSAPLSKLLGHGLPTDISNIIWGSFNFIIAFNLIKRCKKSLSKKLVVLLFIIGIVVMSIFLRFEFSKYYRLHKF